MSVVIAARGLRKDFTVSTRAGRLRRERRTVVAVDGIDLTVHRGEMLGYLGPNGAGKSTTLKMLTGVLAPSGGDLAVCGLAPARQRVALARRIGVVFGQRSQLWWDLPLRDSFDLLRHVYRVPQAEHAARLRRFTRMLELDAFDTTPVRQLSLGQRMRGEITAALLHGPEIVFLDEPTIGLDVVSKQAVREFLAELAATGDTTVLLTTHDLADIERLCPRIVVIDHGRTVHDGSIADLHRRYGSRRTVTADFDGPVPGRWRDIGAGGEVPGIPGAAVTAAGQSRAVFAVEGGSSVGALVAAIAADGTLRDVSVTEPAIEDVIARLYAGRDGATDAAAALP